MARNALGLLCIGVALAGVCLAGRVEAAEEQRPVVQVAVLLDTSNSMDGLIDQAKTQLWRIVNEMATARRGGSPPDLRVALYEYGKSSLVQEEGYIRMILPLTTDLDKVSEELFALKTNGGQEYCGMVIRMAVEGLQWSKSKEDLKLIFIAGNEPFTQGPVNYADACKEAVSKGIVVNTIHCGDDRQGVDGKWKDGALLADGTYTCINQNRAVVHIDAPQDAEIARLGAELNTTYVSYGAVGAESMARQAAQDANAASVAASVNVQRQVSKASEQYRNAGWDLVDAVSQAAVSLETVKDEDLPAEMRGKTLEEKKAYVAAKGARRAEIQARIQQLDQERRQYVAEQMKKLPQSGENTLDQAIIASVRSQAAAKGFTFE
jgi:hypothetical protein